MIYVGSSTSMRHDLFLFREDKVVVADVVITYRVEKPSQYNSQDILSNVLQVWWGMKITKYQGMQDCHTFIQLPIKLYSFIDLNFDRSY